MASIPIWYRVFFLWIEPFSTMLGAVYAFFMPEEYIRMTHAASATGVFGPSIASLVILRQLGNLYTAFAINEAFVLRATTDVRVWRALLTGLLIADLGHLYSLHPLGLAVYYDVRLWGPMDWGNVAFVYGAGITRICFLAGVGMSGITQRSQPRPPRSIKASRDDTTTVDVARNSAKTPKSTRGRKPKG